MTAYGWDASHYDGALTRAILARAKAEGIGFFSHKIGEGLVDTEGAGDDTALASARDAGIELLGGYLVPRTTATAAAQVDRWIALADAGEPWWRDWPGWFWQIDLERWSYDQVPAAVGIDCARRLRDRTGRWTILYGSHGQYGNDLSAWDGPLWNAHYTTGPAGPFTAMYPGDTWRPALGGGVGGWAPYGGREPTFLQYTSSATIAGLSTCDANAYRGSLDQLRALITGGDMGIELGTVVPSVATPDVPQRNVEQVLGDLWYGVHRDMHALFGQIGTEVAGLSAKVDVLSAALAALAAGGTSVDTAAVVTAVKAAGDAESAAVAALHEQIADLRAQLAAAGKALEA